MPRPGVKRIACWSGTRFCTAHAITATNTLNVVTTISLVHGSGKSELLDTEISLACQR